MKVGLTCKEPANSAWLLHGRPEDCQAQQLAGMQNVGPLQQWHKALLCCRVWCIGTIFSMCLKISSDGFTTGQ